MPADLEADRAFEEAELRNVFLKKCAQGIKCKVFESSLFLRLKIALGHQRRVAIGFGKHHGE